MSTRSASTSRTRNTSPSSSGLNLSRAQEKEQLETLNNRLAVYIDTVRRLEHDNRELKVKYFILKKINFFLKNFFLRMLLHLIPIHMRLKHQK